MVHAGLCGLLVSKLSWLVVIDGFCGLVFYLVSVCLWCTDLVLVFPLLV